MSIIGSNILAGASGQAAGGGYAISRSLRFNSNDSAYLSAGLSTFTSRTVGTISFWVKLGKLGVDRVLAAGWDGGVSYSGSIQLNSSNVLFVGVGGAAEYGFRTTAVFRDPSAWYHVVVAWNQSAAAADKVKVWINNVAQTSSDTGYQSWTSGNCQIFCPNTANRIGRGDGDRYGNFMDGYIAEYFFIDGQGLDPTSFGEFDTNGIWQPIEYTGSYGTNGFHLDFADNSSNTATTLGKDTSGNGNNWTPNNLSVTAGAGNDSLVDVPTNGTASSGADPGGSTRGNYCTLNPLDGGSATTLSNGNLDIDHPTSTTWRGVRGTIGASSGKYYFEYTFRDSGQTEVGIANSSTSLTTYPGSSSGAYIIYTNGQIANNNSFTNYGSSLTTGDVLGVAVDLDNNKIWFSKNGAYPNSGDPAAGTNAAFTSITSNTYFPVVGVYTTTSDGSINFGQRPFAYTAPSGFKALCTANLPAPLVTKPNTVMDVKLWTGNGSSQTITADFSPDFVWVKERSTGSTSHHLVDQVRGADKYLFSQATDSEYTGLGRLTAFTSNGFTVAGVLSSSSQTYAGWCWDAGSSTVTNTQGSITSSVRANATAGFSVVTYTGTGANATVGHGLGVAPSLILLKSRSNAYNWNVWHSALSGTQYLQLNNTNAVATDSGNFNGSPSSTIFNIGANGGVNQSSATYVAYCFAPVAGYSSFGSYTGNGSADGPFVYTGFRPAFVLVKMSSSTGNWTMLDTKRLGYNVDNNPLFPNLSNAEGTTDLIDITSNGFKVRTTDATFNTNAGTYVFAAWAESPFQYARAR